MNKQIYFTISHALILVLQRSWMSHIKLLFPVEITRVLCYQQSCHTCSDLVRFFQSVAVQILFQYWKQMIILVDEFPDIMTTGRGYLIMKL